MKKLKRIGRTLPNALHKQNLRPQLAALNEYFNLKEHERAQRRPPIDHDVYKHPLVVEQILKNQNQKCAYCELTLSDKSLVKVTHYRPLSNAVHSKDGRSFIEYYAWFAYEWQNLMVLCSDCHMAISELFPLDGLPIKPGALWQEAELREKPLIINPYKDTPSKHLIFSHQGEVFARSNKGATTIEVLQLNRSKLVNARARSFQNITQLLIGNLSHSLRDTLDIYITKEAEFPGACLIFLQTICRIAKPSFQRTEKLYGDALYRQVANICSGLDESQVSSLIKELDQSNLAFIISNRTLNSFTVSRQQYRGYIADISITNFKDIPHLSLTIPRRDGVAPCMMLLGENATGKSSVLQAIKLALSPQDERSKLRSTTANFSSLLQPTDIQITFDNGETCQLSANRKGGFESRSSVNCLIVGYGARRYFSTHPRYARKKHLNKTLFDPLAMLRDPRDWLIEQGEHFNAVARALRSILSLRNDESIIQTQQRELLIQTHDKLIPIEQLSDGYKSLFIMSVDIMRELLTHWDNLETAEGIVLIDEVETHLHPRWKMRVMSALREAMPRVQFICSTHDPLCLRGMKNGEVRLLQRDNNHVIRAYSDLPDITTLRIEQILSSDFFGLSSTEDPEQDYIIRRLAELAGIGEQRLVKEQREERDKLLDRYEGVPYIGSSPDRQILAEALTRHLRQPLSEIEGRGRAREESISAIMGVLKRAMAL